MNNINKLGEGKNYSGPVAVTKLIEAETPLERELLQDTDFLAGLNYGSPRPGHPEGAVIYHIKEVLDNVDKYGSMEDREALRLIALIHDTFKYKVNPEIQKTGINHHAHIAYLFSGHYISSPKIRAVILKHDDAYNIWRRGVKSGNWEKAKTEAIQLIKWLDDAIDLYLAFYKCDNQTGDKTQEPYEWFKSVVEDYQSIEDGTE